MAVLTQNNAYILYSNQNQGLLPVIYLAVSLYKYYYIIIISNFGTFPLVVDYHFRFSWCNSHE